LPTDILLLNTTGSL